MTVRRNFSSGVAPANSSTSKTYTFGFTAQAGSQLAAVVHANATASTPSGWLKSRQIVGGYAAYLFTKIADGTETSISWTQNGDRPAVVMVWEYDTPLVEITEFYEPVGNGVQAPIDLYGEGAAVVVRLGSTPYNTPPDIVWTGATELDEEFVWSAAESNGNWVSCAEIAYTTSGQHMVSASGMPDVRNGLAFVSSAAPQTEYLAQYSGGASTTHTITFDRPASPGYEVLVFGIGDDIPNLPAGWVSDHLTAPRDCSFVYRLPGASNFGVPSIALTYPSARQMAAVAVEALVEGAPVYKNFTVASGVIVSGGTLFGTGLHTFGAGGTEFAVFWRSMQTSQTIGGGFIAMDQGYSLVAQSKVEPTATYVGHFVGLSRKLNGTGMADNGVTANLSPPVTGNLTSTPTSLPGIIVYTPREAGPPPEPPPDIGDPVPHMLSDGSQWHPVLGADHSHELADLPPELATDAEVTAAIAAHAAAADPHPVYLTQTEGDARYSATGLPAPAVPGNILVTRAGSQTTGFSSYGFNGLVHFMKGVPITLTATQYSGGTQWGPPGNAIDENVNTAAGVESPGVAPSTVFWQLDIGSGNSIVPTRYALQGRSDGSWGALSAWDFKGSPDGSTWTTLHSATGRDLGTSGWDGGTISTSTGYRYFRVERIGDTAGWGAFYLGSFEIYGTLTYAASLAWTQEPLSVAGHVVQDEGSALTARTGLNFVGAGVTATDDSGNNRTTVTIPGSTANPVQATWSMGPSIIASTGGYKWRAKRNYTISKVSADLGTAPGAGESFDVDVTKNGVSILSSSMTFSSGNLTKNGALSTTSLATDDYLEVMVSSVTGATAQRLTVNVEMV